MRESPQDTLQFRLHFPPRVTEMRHPVGLAPEAPNKL